MQPKREPNGDDEQLKTGRLRIQPNFNLFFVIDWKVIELFYF